MDFNTGGEQGFEHSYGRKIDEGRYTGFISGAKEKTSKKGNHMMVLTVAIDDQGDATPDGGVKIDVYVMPNFQPGVDDMVRALLPDRLAEWEESDRTTIGGVVTKDLEGLDVDVYVYHEEGTGDYAGKLQTRCRLLPAPGVPEAT